MGDNVTVFFSGAGLVKINLDRLGKFAMGRAIMQTGIRSPVPRLQARLTCHFRGGGCKFRKGDHDPAEIIVNIYPEHNAPDITEKIEAASGLKIV